MSFADDHLALPKLSVPVGGSAIAHFDAKLTALHLRPPGSGRSEGRRPREALSIVERGVGEEIVRCVRRKRMLRRRGAAACGEAEKKNDVARWRWLQKHATLPSWGR